jgi:hypothetical protein
VLVLSRRRLITVSGDTSGFSVSYLGELWGGAYIENARVDDERLTERSIEYTYSRLPQSIKLEVDPQHETGKQFARSLRPLLLEWSTAMKGECAQAVPTSVPTSTQETSE